MVKFFLVLLLGVSGSCLSSAAYAWGGRGHSVICEAAVHLLKEKSLKEYLQNKPQMMGHLCNIPDILWRNLPGEVTKLGNPTHFLDPEILGQKIEDLSLDYRAIIKKYTGTKNHFVSDKKIESIPAELGSVWWRADQFYRLAIGNKSKIKKAKSPVGSKEEQDENLEYNKAIFDFTMNLGLMGHFVGDASMPFHNTSDYDGYAQGHGGIHSFYEDLSVGFQGPELIVKVVEKAKTLSGEKFLKKTTVLQKMKELSLVSRAEMEEIIKLDNIKTPSQLKDEKGNKLPAQREEAEAAAKKFESLIVVQMARSASLLAASWDEAFTKVGRPQLKAYKSYKYPLAPEFVAPDYVPGTF